MSYRFIAEALSALETAFPYPDKVKYKHSLTLNDEGHLVITIWYHGAAWPFICNEPDGDYEKTIEEMVRDVREYFINHLEGEITKMRSEKECLES